MELLIALGLFFIFSVGAVMASLAFLNMERLGGEDMQAGMYASAGLEIARSITARSFDDLPIVAGAGAEKNGDGVWQLAGTSDTSEQFTRVFSVEEVNRNDAGDIVSDGGSTDPDTKKVTVRVTWNAAPGEVRDVELDTYVTRFRDPF